LRRLIWEGVVFGLPLIEEFLRGFVFHVHRVVRDHHVEGAFACVLIYEVDRVFDQGVYPLRVVGGQLSAILNADEIAVEIAVAAILFELVGHVVAQAAELFGHPFAKVGGDIVVRIFVALHCGGDRPAAGIAIGTLLLVEHIIDETVLSTR